jgi:hypothetical protein
VNAPTAQDNLLTVTLPAQQKANVNNAQGIPTGDDYDAIPTEMRNSCRWLLWRQEPGAAGKKPRKAPYYANGCPRQGELDSPGDMANFATFEDAFRQLQTGRYTGLGFALGPDGTGNSWQGIDLDDVPNRPELGYLADDLPGYTEASPSGNGTHAIGYGRPFATLGSNNTGVEAYAERRFFTVTADRAGNQPPTCLAEFVESRLAPLHRHRDDAPSSAVGCEPVWVPPEIVTDLRSALFSMRADDYALWIRVGLALKTLGEQGRGLWLNWSATSIEKFDSAEAAKTWESLKPTQINYRAVFTEAQQWGWVNPLSNAAHPPSPAGGIGAPTGTGGASRPHTGFGFIQARELLSKPEPVRWLIHGIFEQGALGQLFGDSGSGKSFMAIDWGCCVATGLAWCGREVERGPVFYIAGEGRAGIRRRLKAWELHNGKSLADAPFFVSTAPAALMDASNAANVASAVNALVAKHGTPRLIIVDTLARNLGDGDENSNRDIGIFINNIDVELRTRLGASVQIVHHTGHMDKDRGRGASALKAAMDSEYRLSVVGDIRTMSCTKAKESEPLAPMNFKLEQVPLEGWVDEKGELMTSAVLVSTDEKAKHKGGPRLSGANRIARDALTRALSEDGVPPNADIVKEYGQLRAPSRVVLEEVWRQRSYDMGISEGEQDAKQKAFSRSRKALLDLGLVSVWKGFYWRGTGEPGHQTLPGQCPDMSPTQPDRTGHTPIGVSVVREGEPSPDAEEQGAVA